MRKIILYIAAFSLLLGLLAPAAVWAGPISSSQLGFKRLEIKLGHSRLISLASPVKRVSVGEVKVADVLVITPRQIYINARGLGTTNISMWNRAGKLMGVFEVVVGRDLTVLKERLHQMLPQEPVEVRELEGAVLLSGRVSSLQARQQAEAVAKALAPKKVTSLLEVGGHQQVLLKVRFAEVNRKAARRLNINLAAFNLGGTFLFTFLGGLTNNQTSPVPSLGSYNTSPSSQGWVLSSKVNSAFGFNTPGGGTVNTFLDALKENGMAKILAEPTLAASSGQEAQFLAGGEFPVPVPQKENITILFKKFGVQLKFKPEVLADGRIRLSVAPEVSELDFSIAVVIQGFTIPGLTTRAAKTQIELNEGQSFAIAGLFRDDITQTVSKVPWLGDIPILGALFRSTDFQSNKTELVIVVTPQIARGAMAKPGRLPTDGLVVPNDVDLYLLGKMTRRKDPKKGPAPSLKELEGEFGHDPVF